MDNINVAQQAMVESLRGANTITLDIDSGDKEFKLNSHFESMLEIGAFIIAQSNASTVRISAMNDDNNRKVIDFNPNTGEFTIIANMWTNNTPSIVTMEISEPSDTALWDAINTYDLKATTGRVDWAFYGKYDDLVNFITRYYISNDEEIQQAYISDIVDDASHIDVICH